MTNLYATKYLKVDYDEETSILLVKWMGFTTSEEFKDGIDKIMTIMLEKEVNKTLTDISEHKVIGATEQEYASSKSLEFSKSYWDVKRAIIAPKDIFAKFGLKQVNKKVAEEIEQERQLFNNMEDALNWLKQG